METIDNRNKLFELDEIYKYKDLIEINDKDTLKRIICQTESHADDLHKEFLKLVAMEVNHELNKSEFAIEKNQLIKRMNAYLANS